MHRFIKPVFVMSILLLSVQIYANDIKAITEEGETVILHQDGTWELLKKQEPSKKQTSSDFDFRKTRWGMSFDEIKKSEEGRDFSEIDNILHFKDSIAGLKTDVFYINIEDKLVRARYSFSERHVNSNTYLDDYEKLKKILINKYGEPKKDQIVFKNEMYKDSKENWGMAVISGGLVIYSEWETESTTITLALYGENFKANLIIEYESKELGKLEDKAKEKENEEKI